MRPGGEGLRQVGAAGARRAGAARAAQLMGSAGLASSQRPWLRGARGCFRVTQRALSLGAQGVAGGRGTGTEGLVPGVPSPKPTHTGRNGFSLFS